MGKNETFVSFEYRGLLAALGGVAVIAGNRRRTCRIHRNRERLRSARTVRIRDRYAEAARAGRGRRARKRARAAESDACRERSGRDCKRVRGSAAASRQVLRVGRAEGSRGQVRVVEIR